MIPRTVSIKMIRRQHAVSGNSREDTENSTGIDGFGSTPVASPRRGRRCFARLAAVASFEGDTAYELAADQVSKRNDTVN